MTEKINFFIAIADIILQVCADANNKKKDRVNLPFFRFTQPFFFRDYLLFDFEDAPPLLLEDLPAPAVDFEADLALLPLLLPDAAPLLLDLDAADDFEPPFADLPDDEPPALCDFDESPFSPPSRSPTASAATLSAVNAAPVAAPVRISPAASLTASKIGDDSFFVDFFAVEDLDFVEAALFAGDFDFVEAALFVVDFDFAGVEVLFVDF